MKKIIFALLMMISFIISLPLYSAEKLTVAVLDLTAKGVDNRISFAVSNIIRSEFVNIGNFTVVERSQMKAILDEQALQMTGCTDADCAVEFGKILSARRIVVGEVNSIGKSIIITARYINVESGASLFSAKQESGSLDDVADAASVLAKDLARRIVSGDKEIITPITPLGYYARSSVPGWGQLFVGQDTKGYAFMGGFVATVGFAVYGLMNYSSKQSDYDDLSRGASKDTFDKKYDDAEKAGYLAAGAVSLAALVYIANWVDVLFFSKPDFETDKSVDSAENRIKLDIAFTNSENIPASGNHSVNLGVSLRY